MSGEIIGKGQDEGERALELAGDEPQDAVPSLVLDRVGAYPRKMAGRERDGQFCRISAPTGSLAALLIHSRD